VHIAVAITGASGAPIAVRLLHVLQGQRHEVSLIVTSTAERIIALESGPVQLPSAHRYHYLDMEAPLASSSNSPQALVICPCSMRTLAAVAHGLSDNLVTRCADNMLRLRRPLVLVPRETPLSPPALDNLRLVASHGAFVVPPMLTYYFQPQTVEDLTDFVVGKILDCLGLSHDLYPRWGDRRE